MRRGPINRARGRVGASLTHYHTSINLSISIMKNCRDRLQVSLYLYFFTPAIPNGNIAHTQRFYPFTVKRSAPIQQHPAVGKAPEVVFLIDLVAGLQNNSLDLFFV